MQQEPKQHTAQQSTEKPRWDNWHVRLPNPKDQQKVIALFHKSGAATK